jgi:hypothetical protein
MNKRDLIWLASVLSVAVIGCGEMTHTIGRKIQSNSTSPKKDASVDSKGGAGGRGVRDASSDARGQIAETGPIEAGTDALAESGTDGASADAGCKPRVFQPGLDIYLMMDAALGFQFTLPPGFPFTPPTGSGNTLFLAKTQVVDFISKPINSSIGVGIKFYGAYTCASRDYKTPAVGIAPLSDKSQRDALANAFSNVTSPAGLLDKPALKGAVEYAKERSQYSRTDLLFRKQTVFFFQIAVGETFPNPMGSLSDVCITLPTLQESAKTGHELTPPIETYVIAINPYGDFVPSAQIDSILKKYNETAANGGTKQAYVAKLFPDQSNLTDNMQQARMAAIPCEFSLPPQIDGMTVTSDIIGLSFRGAVLSRFDDINGCGGDAGQNEGWYLDPPNSPTLIKTCPATCSKIKSEAAPEQAIQITIGCPQRT